jgi:hypothetical protein
LFASSSHEFARSRLTTTRVEWRYGDFVIAPPVGVAYLIRQMSPRGPGEQGTQLTWWLCSAPGRGKVEDHHGS